MNHNTHPLFVLPLLYFCQTLLIHSFYPSFLGLLFDFNFHGGTAVFENVAYSKLTFTFAQ